MRALRGTCARRGSAPAQTRKPIPRDRDRLGSVRLGPRPSGRAPSGSGGGTGAAAPRRLRSAAAASSRPAGCAWRCARPPPPCQVRAAFRPRRRWPAAREGGEDGAASGSGRPAPVPGPAPPPPGPSASDPVAGVLSSWVTAPANALHLPKQRTLGSPLLQGTYGDCLCARTGPYGADEPSRCWGRVQRVRGTLKLSKLYVNQL